MVEEALVFGQDMHVARKGGSEVTGGPRCALPDELRRDAVGPEEGAVWELVVAGGTAASWSTATYRHGPHRSVGWSFFARSWPRWRGSHLLGLPAIEGGTA